MREVVDLHVDTFSRLVGEGGEWTGAREDLSVDLPRCREGGVRLLCCACWVPDDDPTPAVSVDRMLDRMEALDRDTATPIRQVRSPAELRALGEGELGILPTIENARSLEGSVERVDDLAARGVRILGVTWNGANELATGCGVSETGGLTRFGREAIERAAARGMAIDISHLNREGVAALLPLGVPTLATHSNARALHDHPRNLDDDQLVALAAADGLVGLNLYPPFLGAGEVSLSCFVSHARHVADLIGAAHLALGSDLDGIDRTPRGFRDHRDLPALADALAAGGFTPTEIDGILGANFLAWWERRLP